MSLTSQLRDKNSPVRGFFKLYENNDGTKECLARLQSSQPLYPPKFTLARVAYAFIGTTSDYLIRYTANKNKLAFNKTVAYQALQGATPYGALDTMEFLECLYDIGIQFLDGRDATDRNAIFSATALAIMDGVYRSGHLPGLFETPLEKHERTEVRKTKGKSMAEKRTNYLLGKYLNSLGGNLYIEEIATVIKIFVKSCTNERGELHGSKFTIYNRALANSPLVGGADFDCVIAQNKQLVLTDLKSTAKKLTPTDLRQLMGYALLHDEKRDRFKITHIGIYHSRSGSFRTIPFHQAAKEILPEFKSITQAKKVFLKRLKSLHGNYPTFRDVQVLA